MLKKNNGDGKKPRKPRKPADPNRPRRKMSAETRAKMSAKRRARTKQPRSGQSKKRQSFYDELMNDYSGNKEALEWIKQNKSKMDGGIEQCKQWGILSEYTDMYSNFNELPIGSVLFGNGLTDDESVEESHDLVIDEIDELEEIIMTGNYADNINKYIIDDLE